MFPYLPIAVASVVIVLTTVIHASAMHITLKAVKRGSWGIFHRGKDSGIYWISGIILVMFIATVLEAIVWALTYLGLDVIQGGEQAFYFSMVTYTTLGYGDMVLTGEWRILSSFQAANGSIMFGWTAALVFAAVQHIYFGNESE